MYSDKPKLHRRQELYKPGNLRTIALDVTAKCNMKCSHCYAETFVDARPIELNILKRVLDEAYEMGVFHYILQGGEPILDPDRLEAIINMCHPDETYINVVSNGWKMEEETINWLKKLKVDKIAISLDSGIEKEHDLKRGKGSFKKAKRAIDNIIDAGLLASISIVVTKGSIYSLGFKKAYNFAKSKGIRIDLQIAEPVGKWDGKKEYLITPGESIYIKQLQINSPVLANGQKLIGRDIFSTFGTFGDDCDHCPAGTEFIGLTVDGQFLPCNFLQFSLGNIRNRTVKDMRDTLLRNEWFDGKHPNCLCGENNEFIDKFIVPYVNCKKPLNAYKIFGLD